MLELVAGIAVAIAALALVLEPLARPVFAPAAPAGPEDPFAPLEESESPKIQALLALKEIEFDRATGKLSDEDYDELRGRYAALAVAAIREEDARPPASSASDMAEAMIAAAGQNLDVCPSCGPRPEADALFCSNCGAALQRT